MPSRLELLAAALADRYRIERELGAGGMATVYLAADLKHDRKVALKVLKPELAAVLGAERFVIEIKTTASLQHPHILPLFDSGTADGFLYYVMPYIDGETLRDKLNRETQLGIDEAVKIAGEVADALDYAHRHGVIHRDIKPENILLHDGRPMVADFGIALALSAAAGGRMTETGLSLGTPHYMSPEQATGEKDITARADVYSLGSVLYEMLAGEPPHLGGSAQQIIMKIIAEPVQPVTKLRKSVPENVAAAVSKALEKLPADRFESAKAFSDALNNPAFRIATTAAQSGRLHAPAWRPLAAVAAASALVGAAVWGWLQSRPSPPVVRYQLVSSTGGVDLGQAGAPTPAPDGSFIVYWGPPDAGQTGWQLWMKRRDSYRATPIAGTSNARSFTLSPDGEWIAFGEGMHLKKVRVSGGAAVTLVARDVEGVGGVAWLDDGTIVFADAAKGTPRLARVSADGSGSAIIWANDSLAGVLPEPVFGKRAVVFSACIAPDKCSGWALDLRSGKAHPLARGTTWPQYARSGHLVYVQEGRLLAVAFDPDRLEERGQPVPLADSISGNAFPIRLSRSGTLAALVGGSASLGDYYEMVWVDRRGQVTPVDTAWRFHLTNVGSAHGWALSPDGTRLAIGLGTEAGDHIWQKQLPRGALSRMSFGVAAESRPRWGAGGRLITYSSLQAAGGIFGVRADGTGKDSLLLRGSFDEAVSSPDGAWLVVRIGSGGPGPGGRDIVGVRRGDTSRVKLIVTPFDEEAIAISPDSKWIAYQSDETGQTEIFVRSFPNTDAYKHQVSSGGGRAPLWSRDGRELFFMSAAHNMMAVRATPGSSISLGEPSVLFHAADDLLGADYTYYTPWDVAPDGKFIMARSVKANQEHAPTVVVAENWLQELKVKMKR